MVKTKETTQTTSQKYLQVSGRGNIVVNIAATIAKRPITVVKHNVANAWSSGVSNIDSESRGSVCGSLATPEGTARLSCGVVLIPKSIDRLLSPPWINSVPPNESY
jgi:hypothetical protein